MTESKLEKIMKKNNITENELISILNSAKNKPKGYARLPISGKSFKYMYFSDSHFGHEEFKPAIWDKLLRIEKREKPDFIVDAGDNLEGMNSRPGHIYELTHIGFDQQIKYAADLLNQIKSPIYGIDGNHDGWYFQKNNGRIIVGDELELRVKNYHNLGAMEGDIQIKNIHLKLFHGNDGTAYADSYKIQKLVESFTGGEKPHIVHSGHYHKALYLDNRNVQGFESGTLMGQSRFMRGKKIKACMGFGVVTVYYNNKGIDRLIHEWVPHYETDKTVYKIK